MHHSLPDYLGNILTRWWWVALFSLICLLAFEHVADKKNKEREILLSQLQKLQSEKNIALEIHEELLRQINSQSDPAWIELTLMKVLGLTPDGQTKAFIKP